MQLLNVIKKDLLYGGLTREEYISIKSAVNEANRKNNISHSIVTLLFWAVAFIVYGPDQYSALMKIFPYALFICAFSLVCSAVPAKKYPVIVAPVKYIMELCFLEVGVAVLIVFQSDPTKLFFGYVLAVLVPMLFIEPMIASIILETIMVITYMIFGQIYFENTVYQWELRTLIVFCFTGIISSRFINNGRFERYLYTDSAEKLADIQTKFNDALKKEVEEKTRRIVTLNDRFIIGMATMVENRDNSTGGHIRRTSEVVRILTDSIRSGNTLQLSDDFCNDLIKAAPMHDLGKIAVDDEILRKPGRFTPEEFEKMKAHAAEGARVVREILKDTDDADFRRIAENIAHYHHERMDGSGYPEGLKGEEIPLEARIMAIADVYDALVSKRVYKESYSFERADQIILEGMGTQFDPDLKAYYEAARPELEEYYTNVLSEDPLENVV
ncbi:MAG: HD-GYP domain-containing protein [Lachnospiraceae bacterium]|nr:HD-GYP domain-containing protein [Lachnospiraceae bacterium]